jgi:uncharacterized membrane protein YesL
MTNGELAAGSRQELWRSASFTGAVFGLNPASKIQAFLFRAQPSADNSQSLKFAVQGHKTLPR